MSARLMLEQARADGVEVSLSPAGKITLIGPQAATAKWTPALRECKARLLEILQAAQADTASWGAADWQGYFNERAAVAEFDGAIPRSEAEAQAYQCCVAEWLCRNPVTSDPGQCAWCRRGEMPGRQVLPYGDATHGHTWLHGECWAAWWENRRQAAVEALAGFGIAGEASR